MGGVLDTPALTNAAADTPDPGRYTWFVSSDGGNVPAVKNNAGVTTLLGGVPLASSMPSTLTLGDVGAIGVGTTAARADHSHPATALTDGTHGSRGGGSLHPLATGSVAGFMPSADFTKLAGVSANAAANTSSTPATQTLGDAGTVGVATTSARADHVHPLTALSDTTHGLRGSGTVGSPAHAVATISAPGFMSAADKAAITHGSVSVANILDYGGDNTGTADNRAAFVAAEAALPAVGGVIYLPCGTYLKGGAVNNFTKAILVLGDLAAQSIVTLTDPSNDGFSFGNWNSGFDTCQVQGLSTNTTGTRAGGETTIPVAELSNFPNSGNLSFGGTAGWVTVAYTGKSAASGAGNFTGCTGVTACASGANVMIRTGGYAINMPAVTSSGGNYNYLNNLKVYSVYNGVFFASALGYLDTVEVRNVRNNAVVVDGNNDKFINRVTTASAPLMATSILVNLTSSLLLQQCQILQGSIGMDLNALNGITIPSVEAINCFFDNCPIGMRLTSTGTGSIYRSKFTNCWFSSATTAGVQFNTTQFDGISFDNCDFYGNGKGIAADVVGGGKWKVADSSFGGNTTAIAISASAAHFPQIYNCEIGPHAAFGANTNGVTVAAGTYKGFLWQGGWCMNNTTNATVGAVAVAAGEASLYAIRDVGGINPLFGAAVTTPAVPASTVVVTNTTGHVVNAFIKGGTITVITLNGVANATTASNQCVRIQPGGTIAVTYSVAFTWTWVGE